MAIDYEGLRAQALEAYKAKNYQKAVECWTELSTGKDAGANCNLGYCYANGLGVKVDFRQAIYYYQKAASAGNNAAKHNLGYIYSNGLGITRNMAEALKWYKSAADSNYGPSLYNLGYMYSNGINVEKDEEKAREYFAKAAEAGYGLAKIAKAQDLSRENPNNQEIFDLYLEAANDGFAEAQYFVANCFADGKFGQQVDAKKAVKLYREAAIKGHKESLFNFATYYIKGEVVEQSYEEAIKLLNKAAKLGLAEAENALGDLYEKGLGVEKNVVEAAKHYQLAADQDLPVALYNLGVLYYNGEGVEKNENITLELWNKAIDLGFDKAAKRKAVCFAKDLKKGKSKVVEAESVTLDNSEEPEVEAEVIEDSNK